MDKIPSSEITPEHIYLSRRQWMRGIGALAGAAALAACTSPIGNPTEPVVVAPDSPDSPDTSATDVAGGAGSAPTDELGDALTSFESVTNYNNYYEFTTDKEGVAGLSQNFTTSPWTVEVSGMVNNPKTYAFEDIEKAYPSEERIYRLRCVEGWSMVIPWLGFPLNKLLKDADPTSDAKYVKFTTVDRPEEMPGQRDSGYYVWPYVEGLRLDEAMNDLTLLSTGLYGKKLLPQNGAPIRLTVPWKYGFKNIKAIVKIELVAEQPTSLWMNAASNEYGFYANVNPDVPHPRWSQSTERRIGELQRRPTLPFNGYSEQVASLYEGMDLSVNF